MARALTSPPLREELILVVTTRGKESGYRLQVFQGFPLDFTIAKPLKGFEDVHFTLHEWLNPLEGGNPTLEALDPLMGDRPRVRFCYDPSLWDLNRLPLEEVFASQFGIPLLRHPLTNAGELAIPYAEEISVLGKLRVMIVYANPDPRRFPAGKGNPDHLPHLKEHFDVLVQTFDGLVRQQLIVFERLDNEDGRLTAQQIIERIKAFNPHVLVYVGHGYQGDARGNGLEWGDHGEERLPFGLLRATLVEMGRRQRDDEKPSMRLLVLIACYSARAGFQLQTQSSGEGTCAREVQVPIVVGMDDKFPAAAVAVFSRPFFGMVSERQSIEEAFAAALKALHGLSINPLPRSRLWFTASHGCLFPPPGDCARGLYLERIKGECSQVSFPNRNTTVNLKDLYVDRVVVERKEDTQQRQQQQMPSPPASERLDQVERHAMEPPEQVVELWSALQGHRRVLLIAEARMGKSTLCQHVVMNCDQRTKWFPILIRFSKFAGSGKGLQEFFHEDLAKDLGLDRVTVCMGIGESAAEVPFGEWLYLQWEAGNALLIVDGLDEEFNDERRKAALRRISLMENRQSRPRVLFTSRPFGTMLIKDAYVLHLKEFEKDEQLRRCALNCERILAGLEGHDADEQRVTKFLKVLNEDHRRKDLARRPGHLVEMYVQFCDTGSVSRFEEDLMR